MSRLIKNIIRPQNSPQLIVHLVEITLFVFLVIEVAELVWPLTPFSGNRDPLASDVRGDIQSQPWDRNSKDKDEPSAALMGLFGTASGMDKAGEIIEKPVGETQLNLTLKGILADRDSNKQYALIAIGDKDEQIYRIGEKVAGAEVLHIGSRRVILRHNGVNESLSLQMEESYLKPGKMRGSSHMGDFNHSDQVAGKQERTVSKTVLGQHLNNLTRILKQAKTVPYSKNGRQAGFRLVGIDKGSIFNEMGLKPNDVIKAVNGISIRNTKDALQAYQDLKTANAFQVDILRGGRDVTIDYSIR